MQKLLTIDPDPLFVALRAKVAGKIVCIATPRVEREPKIRRVARELIRRQGGDCASCRGCLIGKDD